MPASPVLAIDIGGTKTSAALVDGTSVLVSRRIETARGAGADTWLDAIVETASCWRGRFDRAGVAVTGRIAEGRWSALNPDILPVPDNFPLVATLGERLGVPVMAANDAQAAAWGEFRFGAGQGRDMIFVTVSTGVGGGLVFGGRLITGRGGLAGHLGQLLVDPLDGERRLEDLASGSALGRAALQDGRWADPPAVFAAASTGDAVAAALIDRVALPLVRSFRSLQLLLDPDCFVIGGGIGLAAGFLDRLRGMVRDLPRDYRPEFRTAALGAEAGLIGIADLSRTSPTSATEVDQ